MEILDRHLRIGEVAKVSKFLSSIVVPSISRNHKFLNLEHSRRMLSPKDVIELQSFILNLPMFSKDSFFRSTSA